MTSGRARLIEILRERSVQRGDFTLASGAKSDFYLDVRQTTLNAEGAAIVGRLVLERLHPEVVGVGGPTLGADPIACSAAAQSLAVLGKPVHAFLIRKEAKGHGTRRYVEGMASLAPNAPVCLVEDTTTSGSSLLVAVDRAREAGLDVVQCICVVDRQQGAAERFRAAGLTLDSLVDLQEIL